MRFRTITEVPSSRVASKVYKESKIHNLDWKFFLDEKITHNVHIQRFATCSKHFAIEDFRDGSMEVAMAFNDLLPVTKFPVMERVWIRLQKLYNSGTVPEGK